MTPRIYLDHAATTPLRDDARDAMLPWLGASVAANPSSIHRSGQRARNAIETAREQVAAALGGHPAEVTFTSGATEADQLALRGVLASGGAKGQRRPLVVNAAEHAAVTANARAAERDGHAVTWLDPGPEGVPSLASLDAALGRLAVPGALVSVMHTNNETGVRADVAAMAEVAHAHGAILLCDAVQAFGYDDVDVSKLGADLVAVSSHKIGGPHGAGALWVRDGITFEPQALGGGQERGKRAGTHAVAAIVGFGVSAVATAAWRERAKRVATLRDTLARSLFALPGVTLNGTGSRGPKHLNVHVAGVAGDVLLMALDDVGVEVSAGSACSAGSIEPSHVLLAMGFPREWARASVRFSLGEATTHEEIAEAANRFGRVVQRLQASPALAGPL